MANEFSTQKLRLFPEKLANLQQAFCNNLPDQSYPISIELSLTNQCNLNCVWCSDAKLRKKFAGDLSLDVLEKLLIDLKQGGTKGIVIEGGGEPTLSSNFEAVVFMIREKMLATGLITNGTNLLDSNVLDSLEWVRVSLDASTPEQMKYLKKRDSFQTILTNIEKMGKVKKKTILGISYILTKYNVEGLEELVQQLKGFGVNYIQFKPVVDHPELDLLGTKDDVLELQKYHSDSFHLFFDALNDNAHSGNAQLGCLSHSLASIVSANGDVYLCGRLNIYDDWNPIGNINQNSFQEIWQGEERSRQISIVKQPSFCQSNCPACRMTKFNEILSKPISTIYRLNNFKTINFI